MSESSLALCNEVSINNEIIDGLVKNVVCVDKLIDSLHLASTPLPPVPPPEE